jgi:predicted phage tail protein
MKVFKNRLLKSFKGRGGNKDEADVNYSLMGQPAGNFLRSTDYLNSLDLLCEGEIEGFVNPDGTLVKGVDVFQAVYLDGVPVLELQSPERDTVPTFESG